MFGKKKKMEHMMSMMQGLHITSKSSLKQYCMIATKCDVDEAQKLYDFFIRDMEELPMFDPVPPNWMERTKNTANGIFGFIKENQDGILQGVELIRGLMGKGGAQVPSAPVEGLPPIN